MTRFLTIAATAATLAGVSAPAFAQDDNVTMLTGKVFSALRSCDIDGNMIDNLTMAQVAGITLAQSSEDESDRCQKIEAIAMGE